jgi:hypothetical protein
MAAFTITRIQTGDYDRWRPMFDQDQPRAREKALLQRVLQSADDPNEVFVYLGYQSLEDAIEARDRPVSSGVLHRFDDVHGPTVLVDAGRRDPRAPSVRDCLSREGSLRVTARCCGSPGRRCPDPTGS